MRLSVSQALLVPFRTAGRGALVAVALSLTGGTAGGGAPATAAPTAGQTTSTSVQTATTSGGQKRVCVYDHNYISGLPKFAALVGRQTIDCAMVYTGSPDWAGWVNPWYLHDPDPDLNWAAWVRNSPANDRRQLIISQPLIPSGLAGTNWRSLGASGAFNTYAREFAYYLVSGGVGDAIIRLSWEMNYTGNIDNIGTTRRDAREWVQFWRNTVKAMRSVPGAHFKFVWCINNRYRNIPFSSYYPGDDVVDIIGDDVYDSGVPRGVQRWKTVDLSAGGFQDLIDFARSHHKPIAIPEWGVGVPNRSNLAGGDDPNYVRGIAQTVADNNVAFQTYFFAHEWARQLEHGPRSLGAYRAAFGNAGYADGPDDGTDVVAAGHAPG